MTSYAAKLGALVAAGALIATVAIPAYAVAAPPATVTSRTAAVQTLSLATTVTLETPSRDGYSVTKPRPVAAVAAAGEAPVANRFSAVTVNPPAPSYSGAAVLEYAAQFVGVVPYGTGNSPDTSFSCDGFTQYVFAGFGISLPRTADSQARLGISISKADAVAGDFVYWPGQHIGIYDGAGGMYNSPRPGRYVEHVGSLWGSPLFIRLTV
ncbi:C40 family peptidase [Frigoribacterium sp. CG_9.8]|jgi:cell wall-associated NlpC family hydrolase|uniref:C40 family peptidase n=1 Tax=Frigoribacterium sp. CG_9.8 TaxID=2787733 RepID=UPI0018CBDF9D|nr:NlpC/P60 family protein [Frigoribacterium sp. CG_9.8]MBG6106465.1 cell wall-associated NlpC family hydrolase [Frigoribacterium sp. CG_9.8]